MALMPVAHLREKIPEYGIINFYKNAIYLK